MKDLHWIAGAKADLLNFPQEVIQEVGFSLHLAQSGTKAMNAYPMLGFGGASVLEVVSDHDGDTYRAVYTVKLERAVYVLHCFQKKSKKGIKTPKAEIDKIKNRLKLAQEHHDQTYKKTKSRESRK